MGKHNSKLTREELQDLEECTQYWVDLAREKYTNGFSMKREYCQYIMRSGVGKRYKDFIQDCPSGFMTKEEFKQIYGQFFPAGDPTRFVDYVFNVFDVDKNGVITFKEFILAISITTKGSVEEKLNWAFSLYDYDSDGFVSRTEMLDIVTAIYRMHGKGIQPHGDRDIAQRRVDQLFTKLDTDGDGKLSREEFCQGFKNDPWIVRALLARGQTQSLMVKDDATPLRRPSTCTANIDPE